MNDDCCCPAVTNPAACGCCEGIEVLTPLATANRPGLSELSYRIGTHASFMETMLARLSSSQEGFRKLSALTTRDEGDFSIALLDAWASVADVLTFYQERIANEGYLRTATERRSLLELSRLVGYQPRPGVASSVYLAYTLDNNQKEEVVIPKGAKVQSIPGPGELPQTFETSEELKARAQWNNLKPRMTRPQTKESIEASHDGCQYLYLKGTSTNLKANGLILMVFGDEPSLCRVKEVTPVNEKQHTKVCFLTEFPVPTPNTATESFSGVAALAVTHEIAPETKLQEYFKKLLKKSIVKYPNAQRLPRNLNKQFYIDKTPGFLEPEKDAFLGNESAQKAFQSFLPVSTNAGAYKQLTPDPAYLPGKIRVFALGIEASLFGHNAPLQPVELIDGVMRYSEWDVNNPIGSPAPVARFSFTPSSADTSTTLEFKNESSGVVDRVEWNFGDGSDVSGIWSPTHQYHEAETYIIKLTVYHGKQESFVTQTLTVFSPVL